MARTFVKVRRLVHLTWDSAPGLADSQSAGAGAGPGSVPGGSEAGAGTGGEPEQRVGGSPLPSRSCPPPPLPPCPPTPRHFRISPTSPTSITSPLLPPPPSSLERCISKGTLLFCPCVSCLGRPPSRSHTDSLSCPVPTLPPQPAVFVWDATSLRISPGKVRAMLSRNTPVAARLPPGNQV